MDAALNHKPLKVALVALDLTEMDDQLIKYAAMMSRLLSLEKIFFAHIAKDLRLPEELLEKYPDLLGPLDESIEVDIQKKIEEYFSGLEVETKCIVQEGNPIDKILRLSKIKDVDVIFMGRKKSLEGSGIASSGIARNCPCSLFLVTEDSKLKVEKVAVPIDFSNHSYLAINVALEAQRKNAFEVSAVHVYGVPLGYHKTGKSYAEFSQIMKLHAQNDFRHFLEKGCFSADITCEYVLTDEGKYADLVYEYAENNEIDLIVLGSKGRTPVSSILIGSVAEKLAYIDSHIPVLIVKSKGENMGFLDALFNI